MKLSEFVEKIDPKTKLYPHQKMLLSMLEKLPDGAEIKTDVTLRRPPRVWAIKGKIRYNFNGEDWVAV